MSAQNTPTKTSTASNKSPGSGGKHASQATPTKAGASSNTATTPKAVSSSKSGTSSGQEDPPIFNPRAHPDVSIIQGCQRTVVEAKKLGLDIPKTQGRIAAALGYILDTGNVDVDEAVDMIKNRVSQVGENTGRRRCPWRHPPLL